MKKGALALGALAWLAVVDAALARGDDPPEPCLIHAEQFDSFGGPPNFTDGTFSVKWCLASAGVTTTNPCPTGNSLRLDSSGDDPIVWIDTAAEPCQQIIITFTYAQFADAGVLVKYALTNDTALNCAESITTVAGALSTTGGACINVQLTLTLNGARSAYIKFDHASNSNALFLDNFTFSVVGCGCGTGEPTHDCCETGSAGCDDPAVQNCVCDFDPYCCEVEWDALCVEIADALGCKDCIPGCATEFSADFGSVFFSGPVCSSFPELFPVCEGTGPFLGSGSLCGGAGDQSLNFAQGFPYSAAITRCLDLTQWEDAHLLFNYTKAAGTLGPRIDVSVEGGPWNTIWTAPITPPEGEGCHLACVDLLQVIGFANVRLRFSSGSATANNAAIDDILLVPGSGCYCEPPTVNAGPNKRLCGDQPVTLDGSVTAGVGGDCPGDHTVSWSGPGIVSGGDTLSPLVNVPGVYTLTARCGVCEASDTVSVQAGAPPVVNAGPDRVLPCAPGATVQLLGQHFSCGGGSSQLEWFASDGGHIVSGANQLKPIVDAPGTYTMRVTCGGNCVGEDTTIVTREVIPGDRDGDSDVDFADLNAVLVDWGAAIAPGTGGDATGDGLVDFADLNAVLSRWGAGC